MGWLGDSLRGLPPGHSCLLAGKGSLCAAETEPRGKIERRRRRLRVNLALRSAGMDLLLCVLAADSPWTNPAVHESGCEVRSIIRFAHEGNVSPSCEEEDQHRPLGSFVMHVFGSVQGHGWRCSLLQRYAGLCRTATIVSLHIAVPRHRASRERSLFHLVRRTCTRV